MDRNEQAHQTVKRFTAVAMATGAVPVPGASVALVAENTAMVAKIASDMEASMTLPQVMTAFGTLGVLNQMGRTVFMEGARALGWGAGPLGLAGVSALGATTAGLQTWCLGQLAIALCQNDGVLAKAETQRVLACAEQSFKAERASVPKHTNEERP